MSINEEIVKLSEASQKTFKELDFFTQAYFDLVTNISRHIITAAKMETHPDGNVILEIINDSIVKIRDRNK